MPSHGKAQGYSAVARGLTIQGTPPGGPGNRPTGSSRIASEGESFTGVPETWRVAFTVFEVQPTDQVAGPVVRFGWVIAVCWFDARKEARQRLSELGLHDVPFELGRIVR